ncbi:anthranilate synthase component I family protein [Paenibacillus xylaniclasticus]|uniref:anthranilate synthase component I family protein n=1 Tax=Paenibacillus xylaniclasticus TaxID=588083 RepID=UPI000FDC7E92|nr:MULTISPECIES: anthranilate synthase component I family protein [Paenibacillus]GFN33812.1 aminodeoxychorismate synthase, component I [Paenibacillus curdlanolyticus]
MLVTGWEQWRQWHVDGRFTTIPLLHKQSLKGMEDCIVASWEAGWKDAGPYSIVLESGKDGRYTYLGLHPVSVIRGKDGAGESFDWCRSGKVEGSKKEWQGTPLDVVRRWMRPYTGPSLPEGPKWIGGCAGFWSYDVARTIERLPVLASDDLGTPDYLFMRLDELWIVDREEEALYCAVHTGIKPGCEETELRRLFERAQERAGQMVQFWIDRFGSGSSDHPSPEALAAAAVRDRREQLLREDTLAVDVEALNATYSPFGKQAYEHAVQRIQQYIGAGDVFQVNLSLRRSKQVALTAEELYEWLRLVNPSPYMGFLRCPDFQLVSGSPELLVELRDGKLATRPIAGTRRRGRSDEEDAAMEQELRTSEKELAEHIMLVDLERNDLGRIARFGTVKVEELMVIERYSHVMHLVSQVEGELAEGKDAFDVIAATFPGGTITGAPKIRTMEIIEELEPTRRGPYTGSLGWIDYSGNMEFNILIRTMTVRDGVVHIQAGAGIVIDSIPEREYYESLSKSKALWKAVQLGERFNAADA